MCNRIEVAATLERLGRWTWQRRSIDAALFFEKPCVGLGSTNCSVLAFGSRETVLDVLDGGAMAG